MFYFSEEGQQRIQRQIEIIERGTAEALKSKEASRQVLIDVGIVREKKKQKPSFKKK